jgi:hypothetical protein
MTEIEAADQTSRPPFSERHPAAARRLNYLVPTLGLLGIAFCAYYGAQEVRPERFDSPDIILTQKVGRAYLDGHPLPAFTSRVPAVPSRATGSTARAELLALLPADPAAQHHNIRIAQLTCGIAAANGLDIPEARTAYAASQNPEAAPRDRFASARDAGLTCFDRLLDSMLAGQPVRTITTPPAA